MQINPFLAKNSKKAVYTICIKSDYKYLKGRLEGFGSNFKVKTPWKCIFPNVIKLKITESPEARRPFSF